MSHGAASMETAPGSNVSRDQRHRLEQTLLYQIIKQHYPQFVAHVVGEGWLLPDYVRREFEEYLKRAFNIDIETCQPCGGAVRIIACFEDPMVIQKILDHLKEKGACLRAVRLPESRACHRSRYSIKEKPTTHRDVV